MNGLRITLTGLAITSVVALGGLGAGGTAQASTVHASIAKAAIQPGSQAHRTAAASTSVPAVIGNCPQYSLCLWQNSSYTGNMWFWSNSMYRHNVWIWVGGSANDQASSLYNDRVDISGVAKNYPANSPDIYYESRANQIDNLANAVWPDYTSENDSISSIDLTTSS
jgi:Peptidase inhibitor family I36